MADTPTFAEQMVAKLQELLLANPGAQTIVIDGVTTSFVDLEARLASFQAQVDRQNGTRPRFTGPNLGGFVG